MRASVYASREAIVMMIHSQFTGMGIGALIDYKILYRGCNGTARRAERRESSSVRILDLDADYIAP